MIDFSLTAEQKELQQEIIRFAQRELSAGVIERDRDQSFPRELWSKCGAIGLQGLPVPDEYGGSGLDTVTTAIALEAFGYGCADGGLVFSICAHLLSCVVPIWKHGTPEQKARLLPGLCDGSLVGGNATSEPGSGSDAFAMRTVARRDGEGWRINGTKMFVSNGPVADVVLVYAVTDQARGFHGGITAFLVERGTAGFSVGGKIEKMGLRTSPLGELVFDDVRVAHDALLGGVGAGGPIFTESMDWERTLLFADVVPLAGILFNGTTLRTNRWGMRDGDYELSPPPNTYRIALAGASFAMGQGVNDHETFEQLVEDRLNAEPGGERIEILNFSVPAYTPVEQSLLLEKKILQFSPHALFIIGHPYDTENSGRHLARRFLRGVAMPYPYLDSLIAAAGLTASMSLDEASARLWQPPFKAELLQWSLRRMANTARSAGIQPVRVLVTTPGAEIPEQEVDEMLRAAGNAGFRVVDLRHAYRDAPKEQLRVAAWDDHPNAAAHRLIADRLYDALTSDGLLAAIRN